MEQLFADRVVLPFHVTEPEPFPRASVSVACYRKGTLTHETRTSICEREFSLFANGEPLAHLLCSSTSLRELAYGFLYTEGVIDALSDVHSCVIDQNALTASFELAVPVEAPASPTLSSGFGGTILHSPSSDQPLPTRQRNQGASFTIEDVTAAVGTMRSFAREYTVTRGIHCSALFWHGAPLASYEDIGRHNTFDKLAGHCLLQGCDTTGTLLTTTGRISGEMCTKAIRLGVAGIASLSGPTDLAIKIAQNAGVLLAGYVRDTSATIYAGLN